MHVLNVAAKVLLLSEGLGAMRALEWFGAAVRSHVCLDVGRTSEGRGAQWAFVLAWNTSALGFAGLCLGHDLCLECCGRDEWLHREVNGERVEECIEIAEIAE